MIIERITHSETARGQFIPKLVAMTRSQMTGMGTASDTAELALSGFPHHLAAYNFFYGALAISSAVLKHIGDQAKIQGRPRDHEFNSSLNEAQFCWEDAEDYGILREEIGEEYLVQQPHLDKSGERTTEWFKMAAVKSLVNLCLYETDSIDMIMEGEPGIRTVTRAAGKLGAAKSALYMASYFADHAGEIELADMYALARERMLAVQKPVVRQMPSGAVAVLPSFKNPFG